MKGWRKWWRAAAGLPADAHEHATITLPAPPAASAKDILIATLREERDWLRAELLRQQQAAELREAEIRAQLVALANSNALAMSAYYGPARPREATESFGGNGTRRVVFPAGTSVPGPVPSDEPAADRPYANALFGDDHLYLGADFRVQVPATGPAATAAEEELTEATIEAAAKAREAARLGSRAPVRGDEDEEG